MISNVLLCLGICPDKFKSCINAIKEEHTPNMNLIITHKPRGVLLGSFKRVYLTHAQVGMAYSHGRATLWVWP